MHIHLNFYWFLIAINEWWNFEIKLEHVILCLDQSLLFLDSQTSRLQVFNNKKKKCWFFLEPKPQTAAYSTYFWEPSLNATLIQVFTDIESVCEWYWVWILNIKSAIKLKLWTLHSKDHTALHDVKFKNWMLFLCVSSRYKGLYI